MPEANIGVPVHERAGVPVGAEQSRKSEIESFVEGEYRRCLESLNNTGILSLMSETESLGVVGFDGGEYPMPSFEQVAQMFGRNKEVVERKRRQGFTRLQMTPLAMPVSLLAERAADAIKRHAREGKIFQTKRNPEDPDVPIQVDSDEPVYLYQTIAQGEDNGQLMYFPQTYDTNHRGISKAEALQRADICAFPGWSIGLIEDNPIQPGERQGAASDAVGKESSIVGGRKQLENNKTPIEYLKILQKKGEYKGETGWTPEDFLTNFITRLEETNQVSNDWNDNNSVWLLGAYLPQNGLVPGGRWDRYYRQVDVNRDTPDYRRGYWGARSTVRLERGGRSL